MLQTVTEPFVPAFEAGTTVTVTGHDAVKSRIRLHGFYSRPGYRGPRLVGDSTLDLTSTDGLSMNEQVHR